MTRTFISVELPENVKKEIKKIQDLLLEFNGKKTEIENLHLTLKFLGEIDDKKLGQVKEKLKDIQGKSFEAEIDNLGVFSENFIRIVWLHLKGAEELQKKIDSALEGLFERERRFMSHITIARIKSVKNKNDFLAKLKEIPIPRMRFLVESFNLKKSELFPEGAKYEGLGKYALD
jgi:2'-5' RNA ligase